MTTISYTVGVHRDVPLQYIDLSVYNVLGQKVATLVSGYKRSGNYSITWDGSKMASGCYFYRLTAGDFVKTKKMLLLK